MIWLSLNLLDFMQNLLATGNWKILLLAPANLGNDYPFSLEMESVAIAAGQQHENLVSLP